MIGRLERLYTTPMGTSWQANYFNSTSFATNGEFATSESYYFIHNPPAKIGEMLIFGLFALEALGYL